MRRVAIHKAQPGWRRVCAQATLWGVPIPAFTTALSFFDGYRSDVLPANMIQAQRDYFGAHTFRVLPGKENERLTTNEDIREYLFSLKNGTCSTHCRHQLDRPWWKRLCIVLCRVKCLRETCRNRRINPQLCSPHLTIKLFFPPLHKANKLNTPTMAHLDAHNTVNNDTIVNVTVVENSLFPVLELGVLSPTPSSYCASESQFSDDGSHSNPAGNIQGDGTRLTVELLGDSIQPATFDFRGWDWGTGSERGAMNHPTPRQRTLSLLTVHAQAVPVTALRPIPATVPESLPSLYAPSQAEDEEYDDEDDGTEADSIYFCNGNQDAQIRTFNSVSVGPAAGIMPATPDLGFNAPEAFADFEDLGLIVAALHVTAEEDANEMQPATLR